MDSTIQKSARVPAGQSDALRANIKKFYIYVVLVVIVAALSMVKVGEAGLFGRGAFLSPDSIINLLRASAPVLTLTGAFTLVMIAGYIDLSVGSAMSLAAVVFAWSILTGFSFIPSLLVTLVVGILMGALNGYIVMRLRITPVIATLVTLTLFKGIALLIVPPGLSAIKTGAAKALPIWLNSGLSALGIDRAVNGVARTMPAWINDYGRQDVILGLPWAFLVALAVTAVLVIVQRKTILGKYAAAIGGNPVAAELSGINVVKYVSMLYIIMGVFAALAGIARASYMSLGDPLSGDGMELNCIIAVLLGGTAFSGGEGSVAKSMIGAMIIVCVTVGLMTVIPPYWQNVAKGVVLLFAVVLNHLLVRERRKA